MEKLGKLDIVKCRWVPTFVRNVHNNNIRKVTCTSLGFLYLGLGMRGRGVGK